MGGGLCFFAFGLLFCLEVDGFGCVLNTKFEDEDEETNESRWVEPVGVNGSFGG